MSQNYPNSFNESTSISLSLNKSETISLTVFNARGQKVKDVMNKTLAAGNHAFSWDGIDNNGNKVTSGIYFARISAGNTSKSQKLLLIK